MNSFSMMSLVITVLCSIAPAFDCAARAAEDTDADSHADTFRDVPTGASVCFDVVARPNDTVAATAEPRVFGTTLRGLGDGYLDFGSREVLFVVPAVL